MTQRRMTALSVLLTALLTAAGCPDDQGRTYSLFPTEEKPDALRENRPQRPRGESEWVEGKYEWTGYDWKWQKGRWRKKPGLKWWSPIPLEPEPNYKKAEPMAPRPAGGGPWVPGKWEWNGWEWTWKKGHYQTDKDTEFTFPSMWPTKPKPKNRMPEYAPPRPQGNYIWVPGEWQWQWTDWKWKYGHWQKK